ncbi:DUF4111 domain-containing protein [Psychrobacillus glaciei]|uniref:Spectinomycin 9-adenylyltransferase n=1 Tax=Psychrobacillus glaciei TaxID=2283160 RepID=A0A5J6SXW5_9BACI|nr:DUF4111 domain-containing protein [Psychrobacillus glaciei]
MVFNGENCSSDIKNFVLNLLNKTIEIIEGEFVGFYIHGSLAMGGFNPNNSDIDILVVTKNSLRENNKRVLAQLFLTYSKEPFPIEISFLNEKQLNNWVHPCPYDFHYSEFWRERYEDDLLRGTNLYLNSEIKCDRDLAAHIMIINHRGICIKGRPIDEIFPLVPRSHYVSSIVDDFQECLVNIEQEPTYCVLNLIRVYLYLSEGIISSKQEVGILVKLFLPIEWHLTIQKAINYYMKDDQQDNFEINELLLFRDYMNKKVQELWNNQSVNESK